MPVHLTSSVSEGEASEACHTIVPAVRDLCGKLMMANLEDENRMMHLPSCLQNIFIKVALYSLYFAFCAA